jgi:PAS domain S-box-containing protein
MIILIAEDHPDSRLVLSITLESAGHTVISAVNGEEALTKAKKTPPDMIISDILMPVMDGFKLCYAVKQDDQLRHIPFIFYTATYIDIEDEQLALNLGADRFLVKPLDPIDLLKIIDEIVAEKAQEKHEVSAAQGVDKEDLFEQYDARLSKKLTKKTREMDQYKSFFENSQDLFCILTPQGEIAQLNEAMCRFYNYDELSLLGRSAKEFFGESCFNAMVEKVGNKQHYHAEIETQTRPGTCTYLDVTALPYLDENSSLNAILVQARDIGARKIAEADLKKAHDIINRSPAVAFQWKNAVGWPVGFVSENVAELLGYSAEEFLAGTTSYLDIIHRDDILRVTEEVASNSINLERHKFTHKPYRLLKKDGDNIWVEDISYIHRDEHGQITDYDGVIYDVSDRVAAQEREHKALLERKQAEAQRADLEAQLAQKHKIEALGLMAGGMAHNFNNNLAIILGGIDLTRLKLPNDSDVLPLLDNAKIAVLRSRDLIQNILSYSRQGVLNREAVQMALVVDETLKLLRSTIPTTVKVNYQPNTECHDLKIQADATRIQEALINLCNNAIQSMDERGEINIALNSVVLSAEDIPAQYQCLPGFYIKLSVQDTGCGMGEEIIEKIFDPFFTTKTVDQGTGMGLATLQGMVIQQGGLIKVYSALGQGSTFEIYFPISDSVHPALKPKDTTLPRGSEKIIFLDDDEMLANMGEPLLAELGYKVCVMTSSRETLKLFQANPNNFDLLITDQTMPDMTGMELIQELRKIRPNLPAILCTGYSSKVDTDMAAEFNVNAFLMKPLELTTLAQAVRNALDSGASC